MPRKLVVKMSVSLDGFVGRNDGDVEWIFPSIDEELQEWMVDLLGQAGAHLMGRVTYGDMAAHWPGSDEPYAAPMNEIPKIVFSRTLTEATWPTTTVLSGDLTGEITRLKAEDGDDLLAHGGAGFVRALIGRGLVDEYRLVIHPVALGSGLALFTAPTELTLVSSEPFPGGAMAVTYAPATGPAAAANESDERV
ncbi:dihydrofolate reductase family protein [Cryptosporangium japonicum]|uniref:Dihydrofolate reductase family protein n=1 Tax=Cryptosporangium japonicum TaxID=80872 RepID=A0ABN0TX08_9ACTN